MEEQYVPQQEMFAVDQLKDLIMTYPSPSIYRFGSSMSGGSGLLNHREWGET